MLLARPHQRRRGLTLAVLSRAVQLGLVLIVMTLVEELIVGLLHGQPFAATLEEFLGPRWREFLASALLVTIALVPYVALQHVREWMGEADWRRLMRGEERPG
jgi:hypothetical protein